MRTVTLNSSDGWSSEPRTDRTRLLLLGDSTVITSYLPEEEQFHRALGRELGVLNRDVEICNAADNGEFIARYLFSGAYERMLAIQPGADIVVVRFGVNDEKRMDATEFGGQLDNFLGLLNEDFPGATLILETGIYIDPKHYTSDRNTTLVPYWQKTRDIAARRGLPLSDVYAAMEDATRSGNWDLRIRGNVAGSHRVLDASQDTGRDNDMAWFTDIHPNAAGTRVAAWTLAQCLSGAFPDGLPTGQRRKERLPKIMQDYSAYLAFPPERLPARCAPPWRVIQGTLTDGFQHARNSANHTL